MTIPQVLSAILCSLLVQTAPQVPLTYNVKVNDFQFKTFAAPQIIGQQRKRNWCWAAAIQMVLNHHGIFISQEKLVADKFGAQLDLPVNGYEIVNSLNGWFWSIFAARAKVQAGFLDLSDPSQILRLIANNRPVIVGLRNHSIADDGHAYVVTGVEYSIDPLSGRPVILNVTVRDPWPANPSEQVMAWPDFQNRFLFGIEIQIYSAPAL